MIASSTYFPLWLGQLLSSFGDPRHYIALVVLVFQLTGHLAVAALVAAEFLPVLVLGSLAGVVIDRFSRKGDLISADLIRARFVPEAGSMAVFVLGGLEKEDVVTTSDKDREAKREPEESIGLGQAQPLAREQREAAARDPGVAERVYAPASERCPSRRSQATTS